VKRATREVFSIGKAENQACSVFQQTTLFTVQLIGNGQNCCNPLPHWIYSLKKYFFGFKKRIYLSARIKTSSMNKAELISKIADDAGITKSQANATLDSFVEAVTKTLKGGGKVTLVGFGTFSVTKRAARNGRNPQTGEVIKIKAKKVARFKAGKELTSKI